MEYPIGWTCDVVIVRLELYLDARLPLGDALAIAEHLEACVECAVHLAVPRTPMTPGRGSGAGG
jgi:anti-sigma factor RsiW